MRGTNGRPTTDQVLGNTSAMTIAEPESAPMMIAPAAFTEDQKQLILDVFAGGASEAEAEILWLTAKNLGLDPLKKQVHFVKSWDSTKRREVWSVRVGIDGFRSKAESTGNYDGQDEPEFEHDERGDLSVARVRVYRKDVSRPFVGVARWSEYVQTKKEGGPTSMWLKMPYNQLAKCAEAQALRKAFPDTLGGVYTDVEMGQASNPMLVATAPANAPPRHVPADDEIAERLASATDQASASGNVPQARRDLVAWLRDNNVPRDPTGARVLAEFDRLTAPNDEGRDPGSDDQ